MDEQDFITNQRKLLRILRQALAYLLQQAASMGSQTPAHIKIDIHEKRQSIQKIKAWLRAHGILESDSPDDTDRTLEDSDAPAPVHGYNNLPGTSYHEFIPRPQPYQAIAQNLWKRTLTRRYRTTTGDGNFTRDLG